MKKILTILAIAGITTRLAAQAETEIQVYASPTTAPGQTMFELHSNYTFSGSHYLTNAKSARWTNESLEITHGFGKNTEIGLYFFTGLAPDGSYQYLGNHIRPRVTAPDSWKLPVGLSLSVEFGFIRADRHSDFIWEGEIRPIIDKSAGPWYFSLNPNLAYVLSGPEKGVSFGPQFKTVFTAGGKIGMGLEYYSDYGEIGRFLPGKFQEHLLGPAIDLYLDPKWEINTALLLGLTENSNHTVLKILLGRRVGK